MDETSYTDVTEEQNSLFSTADGFDANKTLKLYEKMAMNLCDVKNSLAELKSKLAVIQKTSNMSAKIIEKIYDKENEDK